MNKRYLFLTAWDGVDVRIEESKDLYSQFKKGNENVFAVEIWAPDENIAITYGQAAAWKKNFTMRDSITDLVQLDNEVLPETVRSIKFSFITT